MLRVVCRTSSRRTGRRCASSRRPPTPRSVGAWSSGRVRHSSLTSRTRPTSASSSCSPGSYSPTDSTSSCLSARYAKIYMYKLHFIILIHAFDVGQMNYKPVEWRWLEAFDPIPYIFFQLVCAQCSGGWEHATRTKTERVSEREVLVAPRRGRPHRPRQANPGPFGAVRWDDHRRNC